MSGLGERPNPPKADGQKIARINDTDSLISEPFVDGLAKIQREKYLQYKMAKQENKKLRDKKIVATYLKSKFPDAFSKEMTVPERDFPRLLRLAKRKYVKRIVAGAIGIPVGIAGIAFSNTLFTELFPFGLLLFLLGIGTEIFGAIVTTISASILHNGE